MKLLLTMIVALLAVLISSIASVGVDRILYFALPLIPTPLFQSIGNAYLWTWTCVLNPRLQQLGLRDKLQCRSNITGDDETWVLVSTAKGGCVLSAQVIIDWASACGLCVGAGFREHPRWDPPPIETPPTHPVDLLLAVPNMRHWRESIAPGRRMRCVVLTRDPLERLRSLYLYSLTAGESGLRSAAAELATRTVEEGVAWMFDSYARVSMEEAQGVLTEAIFEHKCTQVHFSSFRHDFDGTVRSFLEGWGVVEGVQEELVELVTSHDLGRRAKGAVDHHVSASRFSPEFVAEVEAALRANEDVMRLVADQRAEIDF